MPLFKGKPSHLLAALSAVLFVTVAGCGAGAGKDSASIERPEPVVEDTPDPQQTHSWPLTGVSAEEAEFGPALSVKIENSPGARPQGGLDRADIVWEQLVEGGMTRFVAMFHSDLPDAICRVRAVRPMAAAIAVRGVLPGHKGVSWRWRARRVVEISRTSCGSSLLKVAGPGS